MVDVPGKIWAKSSSQSVFLYLTLLYCWSIICVVSSAEVQDYQKSSPIKPSIGQSREFKANGDDDDGALITPTHSPPPATGHVDPGPINIQLGHAQVQLQPNVPQPQLPPEQQMLEQIIHQPAAGPAQPAARMENPALELRQHFKQQEQQRQQQDQQLQQRMQQWQQQQQQGRKAELAARKRGQRDRLMEIAEQNQQTHFGNQPPAPRLRQTVAQQEALLHKYEQFDKEFGTASGHALAGRMENLGSADPATNWDPDFLRGLANLHKHGGLTPGFIKNYYKSKIWPPKLIQQLSKYVQVRDMYGGALNPQLSSTMSVYDHDHAIARRQLDEHYERRRRNESPWPPILPGPAGAAAAADAAGPPTILENPQQQQQPDVAAANQPAYMYDPQRYVQPAFGAPPHPQQWYPDQAGPSYASNPTWQDLAAAQFQQQPQQQQFPAANPVGLPPLASWYGQKAFATQPTQPQEQFNPYQQPASLAIDPLGHHGQQQQTLAPHQQQQQSFSAEGEDIMRDWEEILAEQDRGGTAIQVRTPPAAMHGKGPRTPEQPITSQQSGSTAARGSVAVDPPPSKSPKSRKRKRSKSGSKSRSHSSKSGSRSSKSGSRSPSPTGDPKKKPFDGSKRGFG